MLLLLVVLQFTYPSFDADSFCVSRYNAPLRDLASVELWAQGGSRPSAHLVRIKLCGGLEGRSDTIAVPASESVNAGVWLVARDSVGNACGPGNVVILGTPAAAPPAVISHPKLYDIAGRRVLHPTLPGIYFERPGGRIVVVR